MGKNRTILRADTLDSTEAGNTRIRLIKVSFDDGESDIYTVIDDENAVGKILEDAFLDGSQQSVFAGDSGFFSFRITSPFSRAALTSIKPVGGEVYTWGILEEHFPNALDAWSEFCNNMDSTDAFQLGMSTAQMHESLKRLSGPKYSGIEPPFDRLTQLLKNSADTEYAPKLREKLPELRIRYSDLLRETFSDKTIKKQRIHGDYHLGQVLITQSANGTKHFEIIDFEGEPTRSLDYRRTIRSPAVDIAGMLRSFAYAGAVAKTDPTEAQKAFVTGYSKVSGISTEEIEKESKPYILAKAIYEACYELEFRPDWFWIPAKALLEL